MSPTSDGSDVHIRLSSPSPSNSKYSMLKKETYQRSKEMFIYPLTIPIISSFFPGVTIEKMNDFWQRIKTKRHPKNTDFILEVSRSKSEGAHVQFDYLFNVE